MMALAWNDAMTWREDCGSLDLETLAALFRSGALRPVEVVRAVYARVRTCRAPGIWITLVPEAEAVAVAAALEKRIAPRGGPDRLPLYGLPFAVKDNIDVSGLATTAACPDYAYTPTQSAPAVTACQAAGAILIGKTNLDQFATGLVGTRSPYGACSSAVDERYVSGGSSSGSAVAVARGLVSFALGTDTGGSGRIPAGYNDVVGLKPTRGLVSTTGLVPACRSLDCVSVFARRAGDTRTVLHAMRGYDAANGFSRADAATAHLGDEWLPGTRFRFGVLRPADRMFFGCDESAECYSAAIERLCGMGGTPVEINFSPFEEAGELLFGGPWAAERYGDLADFVASHPDSLLPVTRQILESGARISGTEVFEAQHQLQSQIREARHQLAGMACLVVPTAPRPYTHAEIAADPIGTNNQIGRYSYFVNLLDLCAHAVPNGRFRNGMATGITLIAPAYSDDTLASLAAYYHQRVEPPQRAIPGVQAEPAG
jgi:allophanate hydrolase